MVASLSLSHREIAMLSHQSCESKAFCTDRAFLCELYFMKYEFQHQNTAVLTVNLLLKLK